MTGPYSPDAADLITGPLGHIAEARAVPVDGEPIPLDVEEDTLEVTYSEDWAPYAQLKLACRIPDEDALARMDPRLNARVELDLGYLYPDGRRDVHPAGDFGLRTRPVSRPADLLTLDAGSDEYRAQDYRVMWWADMERAGINEAVQWMASTSLRPEAAQLVSDFPPGTNRAELAEMEVQLGDDYWALIDDCAARTGKRIWCDEYRVWRISSRPERTGPVMHRLTVGESGTLVSTDADTGRDGWANAVCLRYRWSDAANNERIVYGRAQVDSGDFAVSRVGYKVHFEELARPVNPAAADAAAASRLRNLVTRGRSLKLTAAAAYWLRPGHTVEVALPTGGPDLHIVQSVTFRPGLGLMDVTTRQPLDADISNGEI